jgi:hypothetical protein
VFVEQAGKPVFCEIIVFYLIKINNCIYKNNNDKNKNLKA